MIPNHVIGPRNEAYSTSETNVILESGIIYSFIPVNFSACP